MEVRQFSDSDQSFSLSSLPPSTLSPLRKMGLTGCSIYCLPLCCGRSGSVGGGGSEVGWESVKSR